MYKRQGLDAGAIRHGGVDEAATVSVEEATRTALLAFTDGLYQVFIDDDQIEELDQRVRVRHRSRLTFLRLVALAGG